jgi:AraC-like DNA-binding protein
VIVVHTRIEFIRSFDVQLSAMSLSKEILFFFCALGVFNGLLLSLYLFINGKKNNSVYFLGLLLLTLSLRIGKSVWVYFIPHLSKLYLQIGLSACFLIGPSLIYFIKAEREAPKKIPKSWLWVLAACVSVIVLAGIIYPYVDFPDIWNRYYFKIIYAQWGLCILFSGYLLKDVFNKTLLKREKPTARETWLLIVWSAVTIIYALYLTTVLVGSGYLYITGSLSFSFILYIIIVFILYRKKPMPLWSTDAVKYGNKKVSESDAKLIQSRLDKLMTERQFFKNPDLKLGDVAREINIPAHQLSQLLNDNLGKSFTWFVNEYRINEASKMLLATNNLTIEAIGFEVGFNSRSTFFSAFKKLKGTTPALFQQQNITSASS